MARGVWLDFSPHLPLFRAQLCAALTTQHHTRLQKQTEHASKSPVKGPVPRPSQPTASSPTRPAPEQHRCIQRTSEAQYPSLVLCEVGQVPALSQLWSSLCPHPLCRRGLRSMTQPSPFGLNSGLTVTNEQSNSFSSPISRLPS